MPTLPLLLPQPPPHCTYRHRRTLSSHALDALKEFYTERDTRAKQFEQLKAEAEDRAAAGAGAPGTGGSALKYPLSMDMFGEDWNESQFWVSRVRRGPPGWLTREKSIPTRRRRCSRAGSWTARRPRPGSLS